MQLRGRLFIGVGDNLFRLFDVFVRHPGIRAAGKVFDAQQSERLKKAFRRSVQKGPAKFFRPPDNLNEPLFQKLTQHVAAMDAADTLDVYAQNRLFVRDDRERLHRRTRQAKLRRSLLHAKEPGRKFRQRAKLKPARYFRNAKRRADALIPLVERANERARSNAVLKTGALSKFTARNRLLRNEENRFDARKFFPLFRHC